MARDHEVGLLSWAIQRPATHCRKTVHFLPVLVLTTTEAKSGATTFIVSGSTVIGARLANPAANDGGTGALAGKIRACAISLGVPLESSAIRCEASAIVGAGGALDELATGVAGDVVEAGDAARELW
jgi:hypothetical protein